MKSITVLSLFLVLFVVLTFAKKPNIVFILTDDQDILLDATSHMPKLKKYISDEGNLTKLLDKPLVQNSSNHNFWIGSFS